ncbi:DUF6233 domain-containing protein [Streptomyces sp. NPDC054919]
MPILQSNARTTFRPTCPSSTPCGPGTRCGWTASTRRSRRPSSERERQQGEERRPPTPDWVVELSIGVGARPIGVHVGGCYAAGKRHRVITREQALAAALADGMRTCVHCRPDTALGVLG